MTDTTHGNCGREIANAFGSMGAFTHRNVPIRWTVGEDGESAEEGGKSWVLQVRMIDVSISRRYPERISQLDAEREARLVAPMLFQIADEWLK